MLYLVKKSTLQNSPYFCVFKYARAVKQKVWNEAENRERDWGERLKILIIANEFFLSPHTPYGHVRLLGHAKIRPKFSGSHTFSLTATECNF